MKCVFDTNILIDYLNGVEKARAELVRYQEPWISIITRLEVLTGVTSGEDEQQVKRFLSRFRVGMLDESVCEWAVSLRKEKKLKIPDAIIYATAKARSCLLVTRNTRDFSTEWVDVRCPYTL